eukprot:Anaeramoba_flamelloidesa1055379_86.p2 GENE.a1055379_86~~a1055379_86.p2  ORF type:complete len:154 (+),score=44.45 a1055379_86:97-558(+)
MFKNLVFVLSTDLLDSTDFIVSEGGTVRARLSKNTDYFIVTLKSAEELLPRIEVAKKNGSRVCVGGFLEECKNKMKLVDYNKYEIEIVQSDSGSNEEQKEKKNTDFGSVSDSDLVTDSVSDSDISPKMNKYEKEKLRQKRKFQEKEKEKEPKI